MTSALTQQSTKFNPGQLGKWDKQKACREKEGCQIIPCLQMLGFHIYENLKIPFKYG